ncbi:gustatory receptor for bitter taste 93a-like [Teleopsis dalmanni]|uniref:gustatory receptor for bitter taste 93a-like n=1 Tax=Teleopsis dalmanni TaxID=139649 RepID=UPI0018CCDE09|nr:gustatory receptor for bitter taste 93a-like [Teleopsis dalmanni]
MDINIALIRAIQEFPVLFEKTGSFQQKMEAWKELAKQFDMSEKSLRARWHSLLRNFLKDAKYKYGDEMSYLLPHLGIEQNLTGIETRKEWPYAIVPEFDIAEEDINKICVNKRQVHVEVEHVTNKVDVVVMKKEPVLNEITTMRTDFINFMDLAMVLTKFTNLALLIMCADNIVQKSEIPNLLALDIVCSDIDERWDKSVETFINQRKTENLEIKILGFFQLQNEFILVILSAIISYMFILVQFGLSDAKNQTDSVVKNEFVQTH